MAKTKAARTYRSIPYHKIEAMWGEGKSYEQIAKSIKRFDEKAADPTKPTRAIVSRMLNVGWTDDEGKTHTLKAREGMRNIGAGKKAPKTKNTAKKAAPKVAAKHPGRTKGSPVIVSLAEDGKFVRVKLGGLKGKIDPGAFRTQAIGVLDRLGFAVVAKEPVVPVAAAAEAAPASEEVVVPPTPETQAPQTDQAA